MAKPTDKPTDKPAQAEPKPRPVKRPPRPKYAVPRGIAYLDDKKQIRLRAGSTIEAGILPAGLEAEYLERGDTNRKAD